MAKHTLLLVEDEKTQRDVLAAHLEDAGYQVLKAETAESALGMLKMQTVDCVISDFHLPEGSGQDLLESVQTLNPSIPVILVTAYASVDGAVEAMQTGAYHYLTKPVNIDELLMVIKRALQHQILVSENIRLKKLLDDQHSFSGLIASSARMEKVLNLASRVAETKASILLNGESGTGKEVLAKAIHLASPRKEAPFIGFNVAALPATLIESELFGHEKGAFTGADKQRIGRFELANGGTLFIDEIGDIPVEVQTKFLRVLQENYIERLGGSTRIDVDIRVIAATHKNLETMIREGTFREDLYYRLNVVNIQIPPLRERKDDIPALSQFFLTRATETNHKSVTGFTREAFDVLMKYDFPGNVRELENAIERAVILSRESEISLDDLPESMFQLKSEPRTGQSASGMDAQVEALEKELIASALRQNNGNQSNAARQLEVTERKLRYKMQKYGFKEK